MVRDEDNHTRGTRAAPGDATADGQPGSPQTEPASLATTGPLTIVPTWGASTFASLPDPGYQLGELIGRGGMGEVVVAQDQRIGREVAVKRIRGTSPSHDSVARFLREARIQARLDHPAIVPVYELGTDSDGRPYFTMKRLTGETLSKRLAERAPIQPLLRAFVDVCLAIQLAHSRGVVHRDLKPSNIMLGDYGEVYVIDWGVARVLTDRGRTTNQLTAIVDDVVHDGSTTEGAILGTPGYMAPEQVRGHDVTSAADVYALGAILFEILAAEPLHARGESALATTLTQPQVAPAKRAPDRTIAPELDIVCFDALAENPGDRPTARGLADRIQAYLDGDRDLERRRTLAATQLASARDALESDADDARSLAMQRAGRALALDPESGEAATLVAALILEPPAVMPAALVESLEQADRSFNAARSRVGALSFGSLFLFWFVVPFIGIKSWTALLAFYGLVAILTFSAWQVSKTGRTRLVGTAVMVSTAIVLFTRVAGPFILTPVVAVGVLIAVSAIPSVTEHPRPVLALVGIMVLLPLVLEWAGVLPKSWEMGPGVVSSTSDIFQIDGRPLDKIVLIIVNLFFILVAGWSAFAINGRRRRAQRELHIREWHLRQLLPAGSARPWRTRS